MRVWVLNFLSLSIFSSMAWADSYTLDPTHTYPNFTVNHLGFSTMHGRFDSSQGKLNLDMDKGTGSVEVTIAADSISTGLAKRDKHLRSQDFLNVKEFPSITFKSTKVKIDNKKTAVVEGDLTIIGVTKPVVLNVDRIHCGVHPRKNKQMCGFNATTKIKRSEFGMKYGLPAVGDELNIELEVEAVKD